METAGMQVVLGADYSGFEQAFMDANALMNQFNTNAIKTATSLKNVFSGINTNVSLNFNSDDITGSLNALIKASDGATESITTIIAQVQNIPSAFAPSVDIVNRLADALAALSGASGGAIGGNSITAIGDSATRVITEVAGLSGAFTAADASAETFIQGSVSLANSLEVNVSILNLYKEQLAQVNEQIKTTQAQHAGTTQAIMAQTGAVDELSAQQAILKQQISQANTVISAQAKEMIANDGSYKSLQNNLTLVTDAYKRLSEADRNSNIGAGMLQNINQLQTQLKGIDAQMGNFQRNVGNYGASVSQLNFTLQRSFHGLAELFISPSRAILILANDIPQLANQFISLNAAAKEAREAGDETASAFAGLSASSLALNLGIGLALTGLIKFGPKLYDLATGAEAARAKAEALKKEQDALNQITENANKSAGEQVGTIETLSATMTNNKLSMEQRTNAYNEALKLYPSYLDNISKEDALTGGLSDTINNKLIPAILAAAQARAYEGKINQITAENIDLQEKQTDATNKAAIAVSKYQQAQIDAQKTVGSASGNSYSLGLSGNSLQQYANSLGKVAETAVSEQEDITEHIGKNNDLIKNFAKDLQNVASQTGHLDFSGKDIATEGWNKTKDQVDKLEKSAETLAATLKDIDLRNQFGDLTDIQAAQDKLNAYNKDLLNLFKNGGSDDAIQNDISQINVLTNAIADMQAKQKEAKEQWDKWTDIGKIFTTLDNQLNSVKQDIDNGFSTPLEAAKQKAQDLQKAIRDLIKSGVDSNGSWVQNLKLQLNITNSQIDVNTLLDSINNQFKQLTDKKQEIDIQAKYRIITSAQAADEYVSADQQTINKVISDYVKSAQSEVDKQNFTIAIKKLNIQLNDDMIDKQKKDLLDKLNKELVGDIAKGFEGIGDAIGDALSGDNLGDVFASFMSSLGEQIENFGKQIIEYETAILFLKKAILSSFFSNPIAGIAAGIGIVALGELIKKSFSKSGNSTAFADGGVVYGPTNALIGEYAGARNNPEVVAPLNKLQNIIGGTTQPQYIIPSVKLSGSDIWLSFQRTQRGKNR